MRVRVRVGVRIQLEAQAQALTARRPVSSDVLRPHKAPIASSWTTASSRCARIACTSARGPPEASTADVACAALAPWQVDAIAMHPHRCSSGRASATCLGVGVGEGEHEAEGESVGEDGGRGGR